MNTDAPNLLPPLPRLPAALPRSGVSADARLALRQLLGDVDRALAGAFAEGVPAAALARRRGEAVERIVGHVWSACLGEPEGAALFAVGGFGRGLLFPHSDVDLLALATPVAAAAQARALEALFACLWDLGLKPGHAVRDPAQCRALAAADVSVYTSLLDARRLCGDPALSPVLATIVDDPALWPPAAYLAAKREDQAERHARFDDTAYNLEPNLKDGPGGLRTLDLMRWLGRRIVGAGSFEALAAAGLLDPAESAALAAAEATLQRTRYALHLEAGRAEERLLFDFQRALAARLGYVDEHAQNLGVEQCMQAYYRAAQTVERLGTQLLERFDELLEPPREPAQPIDQDFVALGGRLEAATPDLFLRRPQALVGAFAVLLDHPELKGLSADTMRRMQQALARHGTTLADDGFVLAALRALLMRGAPAVEALARMNRHGVLAAVLPAFGRVVGRMQYDLFHVYTVDEHTLRVLRNVARFADPAARRELPVACEVWAGLAKPELLLLAALFHDIAKGRGGDHSQLGEQEARAFCARLGLAEADIDLVAWLVRWHLLMSVTAQRQDITDPDVVHRFAAQVEDWERLDYLYLLTIADIAGTSPKLWNAWKDRLLADLYAAARYALRGDLARPPHAEARVRECRERALALLSAEGFDAAAVAHAWAEFPDESFLRHRPEQIAWQTAAVLREGGGDAPLVAVHPLSVRGCTELFVYTPDREGLFAAITATLDRLRFSVVEARVLSSKHGVALDTFLLLETDTQAPANADRAAELREALRRVLVQAPYRVQLARRGLSRQLRHFQMTPRIEFSDGADGRTQLALVCTDRPGLLAAVAQAFRDAGMRVHDARIATFGERVEDFFRITDARDRPLAEPAREALRAALLRRIGGDTTPQAKGHHAGT